MAGLAEQKVGNGRRALLLPLAMVVTAASLALVGLFGALAPAFHPPLSAGLSAGGSLLRPAEFAARRLKPEPELLSASLSGASAAQALAGGALFRVAVGQDEEELLHAPAHVVLAATALTAAAASASSSSLSQDSVGSSSFVKLIAAAKLPIFVACWYFFNVQYNLTNKMLLRSFDATWAVSWLQLASGIPIAAAMWLAGIVRRPSVSRADLVKLAPVGAAFAAGQVLTVASLGAVAVSFTHVVKALEPAVNAIASALILGQVFHPMVYASLLPVFTGVALASASELSFTTFGFATAMASNFAFVARNVLATKFGSVGDMGSDQTERKTNQLAVLTFVAAAVVLPLALLLPGGLLSAPDAWARAVAKGVPPDRLAYMMVTSGFYFYMYQLSSFWVLSCVPPITHSVLNTLKRIVIIIVSIIVFRTPVSFQSALGTGTAIGGVLLYSLTKAYYAKKQKK